MPRNIPCALALAAFPRWQLLETVADQEDMQVEWQISIRNLSNKSLGKQGKKSKSFSFSFNNSTQAQNDDGAKSFCVV